MNIVDRLLNSILAESPAQPVIAPPKPAAPPAPSKPRPGTRPTIPTRRPGVAPRPKAKRDDKNDARTYPKATDISHFTSVQSSSTPNFSMAEAEGGAIVVPPPPSGEGEHEGGPQPPSLQSVCDQIKPGDRVTIITPHGQRVTGRAVLRNQEHGLWVINAGGAHGTPQTADDENIVLVKRGGKTIYGKL